jgi:hypothetical protein
MCWNRSGGASLLRGKVSAEHETGGAMGSISRTGGVAGRPARTRVLLLVSFGALLLGFTATQQETSPHSTSRLGTIDSLVERGTFALDGSPYVKTVDKVYIGGRYYSHQPPSMALAGALVYYPLHLLGMRLGPGQGATTVIVTFVLNGLSTLASLVFFFRALQWTTLPQALYLPLTASLACGTLWLPFSTTLNSHGFCAALIAVGLYYLLLSRESDKPDGAAFCSGLAFSLCAASDHAMLVFYGLFGVCMLLRPGRRSSALWFFLPSLLTLAPTCAYYYAIGHNIRPFAARPEFFAYSGSQWSANGPPGTRLTGGTWNRWPFAAGYGTLLLVGTRRGFLIFNSTAGLALYGLARSIRTRTKYWREAAVVLAGSAIVVAYYAFSSANYSGASYSIRWFVPFLPLWWFFGSVAIDNFDNWTPRQRMLTSALCAVSVFYALAGAVNPWPYEWRSSLVPLINIKDQLTQYHLIGH